MSYLAQARLTEDSFLIDRVGACAAGLGVHDARLWAVGHMWALSAQPGWSDSYGKVLDGETVTDPAAWAGSAGADPAVITDRMILHGVTAVLAENAAKTETEATQEASETLKLRTQLHETRTQVQLLTEAMNQVIVTE
ncbi:hypothetical protein G7068_08275 [Leucobacter viscericola]|uniref:Uncharacterized protein n=1 Tax=Leucobacter viscericola TaxID=2714935 RepID=A0A6G7XFP4_9MICO|nr:hypothetical protein [Leucobacter viscericola]QIK63191.1 hypothetical protein G7068_08275 [Leucobacter viscericola]